jgi:Helix-turn-helix domain
MTIKLARRRRADGLYPLRPRVFPMASIARLRFPSPVERQPGDPFRLKDVAARLRLSENTLINQYKAGKIRLFKIGRLWFMTEAEFIRIANGVTNSEPA